MTTSNIKGTFSCDIQKIWNIVTSLTEYSWRSDIRKIEVLNDQQFIEYTKDSYATTFTITAADPCKRWEFSMENDNMTGHFTALFSQKGGETTIDLTEQVTAKKIYMTPFLPAYLKKQQTKYLADLSKAL